MQRTIIDICFDGKDLVLQTGAKKFSTGCFEKEENISKSLFRLLTYLLTNDNQATSKPATCYIRNVDEIYQDELREFLTKNYPNIDTFVQ